MTWETQGRQDHGWFGHGTGPGGASANTPAAPVAPRQPATQAQLEGGQNADMTMSAAGQAALADREGQMVGNRYYNDIAHNCTYGVGLLEHLGPCSGAELGQTVDAGQAQTEFQRRIEDAATCS